MSQQSEKGKPISLFTINAFKHDGRHYAVEDVVFDVEPELAKELTGAGRTRLATPEEISAARRAARKAEKTEA